MIRDALNVDMSSYKPISSPFTGNIPSVETDEQPKSNPVIRCPLPYTTPSPDALRQFYMGNRVPQYRLITK